MVRCLIAFILLITYSFAEAAVLKQLNLSSQADGLNISIQLDSVTVPKMFRLNYPDRLVVDFPNTTLSSVVRRNQTYSNLNVRIAQYSATVTRLVLQSNAPINYQVNSSSIYGGYTVQLAIKNVSNRSIAPKTMNRNSRYTPLNNIAPFLKGKRKIVVVIDPGHGGKDPGAHGFYHHLEKDVVLAISKHLQQKINNTPGMTAVLTRDGDYFIDLRRRLDISRRYHPDIFVAIHADAFSNSHSHGASVFALSSRGATSEAARWLAEKENYSELGGVNLRDLDDKNGMVRTVLMDLSQTATIQASINMGQHVLDQIGHMTSLHNHHVEQAGFVVLKSPDTPSILVETGFISNPYEERNLSSPVYQDKLAQAIFNGLHQYFREYPPRGTQFR
jgi:N-acetylmuramoyl-L-alanine amidase